MRKKVLCDILIKNTSYLDENMEVQDHVSIIVAQGKILKIFSDKADMDEETQDRYETKQIIDGENLLWIPGLVDGHMHTGQQLLKGAVLDELPMIWTRIMLPFESTLTPEKMQLSAQLAALEMIKNGTTGFIDAGSYYMEEAAKVYLESGLRGAISHSSIGPGKLPGFYPSDNRRSTGISG